MSDDESLRIIRDKELAKKLGVSTVTLWRMRFDLPPKVQISKGIAGRRVSDMQAWLEKRSGQ